MDRTLHWLRAARQALVTELRHLVHISRLLRATTSLVHQLQRERGLSNLYLGGDAAGWHDALQRQVEATDQACSAFLAELDSLESGSGAAGLQRARLLTDLARVHQGLQALPWLRRRVREHGCSPRWATQAYVRLIQTLLSMVFEAADAAQDPDISRCLVALYHLVQGKELAGQERACGAAAFARGAIEADEQQLLLHLIEAQQRSLEMAASLTSSELTEALNNLPQQSELLRLERLRRQLTTALPGAPLDRGTSAAWFAACTARLDALHDLEERLVGELRALCEHKCELAQRACDELSVAPLSMRADDAAAAAFFEADDAAGAGVVLPPLPAWPHTGSGCVLDVIETQARQLQQVTAELEKVRHNLQERRLIERAKGLLMAHQGLTEAEAHRRLRQMAMNQGRRLAEVAQAVLSAAELLPIQRSRA